MIRIGTAGWSIPAGDRASFPDANSGLERYAARFAAVEINSSFHRPHRRTTYERWAASVPDSFRFAVKLPKAMSHGARLVGCGEALTALAGECSGLGAKLGVILVQLPPSLAFDAAVADAFFAALRAAIGADIACEPRHASWFTAEAEACMARHHVARVAADPVLHPGGEHPGGWTGLRYHRLHGSPRVYWSAYDDAALAMLAATLATAGAAPAWCIFDNTAGGGATGNALDLMRRIDG